MTVIWSDNKLIIYDNCGLEKPDRIYYARFLMDKGQVNDTWKEVQTV